MLLYGLERSLALPPDSLRESVLESRLQLWGAAVPVNVWTPRDNDTSTTNGSGSSGSGTLGFL